MSAAAVLLACALLVAPDVARIRLRLGRSPEAGTGKLEKHCSTDPLAAASTFDAMAVCLNSGMSVSAAAAVVAPMAPVTLGSALTRAADLLALGADPDAVWRPTAGSDDKACAALMRLARRSASSGTALAAGLVELADHSRQEFSFAAEAAAERAGVLIAGPLGLCFLPAFVCVGIIPVVISLAGDILSAGPML
jgi:pilus assembly protein TadC